MTRPPRPDLRASSMNALAHGADSLYTPFANPVSRMTALRGAELIATSLDEDPAERNRAALALGLDPLRLRDRLRHLRPPPRRLPDAGPGLRQPPCRDQRRDPAPRNGLHGPPGPRRPRASGDRDRNRPRPASKLASSSSAATHPAWAPRAPTATSSTRRSTRCSLRPELAFTPEPPTRADLRDADRSRLVAGIGCPSERLALFRHALATPATHSPPKKLREEGHPIPAPGNPGPAPV